MVRNLTGQKFGRLTVIGLHRIEDVHGHRRVYYKCACDCGNYKIVRSDCLVSGNTTSCGCYNREKCTSRIDDRTKEKLYRVYYGMKQRCYNTQDKAYKYYGARGIKISPEWSNYLDFKKWAYDNGYKPDCKLTIERINVNGDYSPENCKWIFAKEQSKNTRRTIFLTYNHKTMCITDWAKELNVNKNTFYHWIKHKGMTIDEVIKVKCIDYPERE